MKIFNIYKLVFEDGSQYIGQTYRGIQVRYKEHIYDMQHNKHSSYKLQNKYNETNRVPSVVCIESGILEGDVSSREVYWIEKYDTFNTGLNCTKGGGLSYGENSNSAKYTLDDYTAVVICLALTNWTFLETSAELEVSLNVVRQISNQQSHTYLKDLCPEEYAKMIEKASSRMVSVKRGTPYPRVISPEGEVFEVTNAHKFAKDHLLQQSKLCLLLNKNRISHKGWTLA